MWRAHILCISTGEVWRRNSSRGCCYKPSYERDPGFSKECETGGAFTDRFAAKWKFCYVLLSQLKPKEDGVLPSVYQPQRPGMFGERSTDKADFSNTKQEPQILPIPSPKWCFMFTHPRSVLQNTYAHLNASTGCRAREISRL